jgi:hypothetical protein
MKRLFFLFSLLASLTSNQAHSQAASWSAQDRMYMLNNLTRSRDELLKEIKGLSAAQIQFREQPGRWNINEVLEHICLWEMLFAYEVHNGLTMGKKPERMGKGMTDQEFEGFILEDKPHVALEYTKPYSYTVPRGMNTLESNRDWFLKLRTESIVYIRTTQDDLRAYFNSWGSLHQVFIYMYGHTDRHLRQIKKIKAHPGYPKS